MKEKRLFHLSKEEFGSDMVIFGLEGALNVQTAPEFEEALKKNISEGKKKVILEMSHLNYISSIGLGVIIGYLEETREQGGDIRNCGVNDPLIQDIFENTVFQKIIQFHKDLGTSRLSF